MALSEKELAKKEEAREEFNKSLTGLSMNIRSINYVLSRLFQRYSTALNKITGGEILGNEQIRQIQYRGGLYREYDKGQVMFKNNIDKLQFLLDNRSRVSDAIGVTADEIWEGRRDFGKMTEYIARLNGKYDVGVESFNMQMYISKHDNNVGSLDSEQDWVDYILTKTWTDNLGMASIDEWEDDYQDNPLTDQRIKYLANMLQGMMKDHELDYHKNLDEFDPNDYMDSGKNDRYIDAMNKLHSIGRLDYVFYELFKPIGGTNEKYIKVKLYTNGELDITGVVSLSDCEHIVWEYGTKEYLRALNTGNQRYDFKLSIPFNDDSSVLWWKPDDREVFPDDVEPEHVTPDGWTVVKYVAQTSLPDWEGDVSGELTHTSIPNLLRASEIKLGSNVTGIGAQMFLNCSSLASLDVPQSVTNIGYMAFYGCSTLTEIHMPNSIKTIGERAFENCKGLTTVSIPNSVTSIGNRAFYGCNGLLSISVGSGNDSYKSVNGLLLTKDGKELVSVPSGIASVNIPTGVVNIAKGAFNGGSSFGVVKINAEGDNFERIKKLLISEGIPSDIIN